jgi:hypothetical protein
MSAGRAWAAIGVTLPHAAGAKPGGLTGVSLPTAKQDYTVVSSSVAARSHGTLLNRNKINLLCMTPGGTALAPRLYCEGGSVMTADIVRPALVVGILLAAASYAATKEWQWQADLPFLPVAQIERIDVPLERAGTWHTEAVTVQPEQIFQD